MISEREREGLAALASFCGGACLAIALAVLIGLQQHLDAADEEAARQHAARQAQAENINQNVARHTGE